MPPLDDIAAAIARCETFYITTHVGPDGDAIGTGLALKLGLEALGKTAVYVSRDGVPPSCRFLPHLDGVLAVPPADFVAQCAFVLDCDGTPERVASPYEPIQNAPFKILIDHHRTSAPIFDLNWIDPVQPATALMIFRLLEHLEVPLTAEISDCLLCGLSTDTGHFRFPNATPESLRAAAQMVQDGGDLAHVAFKLFDERSFASTQLLGLALSKIQSTSADALVWTALSIADFSHIGTGDESSENVVNFLRNVKGCRMALIFRERREENGSLARISVRAEPQLRADLFANEFGGGGHAAAAGFRKTGPFEETVALVIARAQKWLEEEHPSLSGPD